MSLQSSLLAFPQTAFQSRVIKIKWTPEEDALLKQIVEQRGPHRWDFIASFVPGRNGKQCRERYLSKFAPNLSSAEWSYEEDMILLSMQQQIGNHWSAISKCLPGRTAIMAKNRFKLLKRKNITFQPKSSTPSECSSPSLSSIQSPTVPNDFNIFDTFDDCFM